MDLFDLTLHIAWQQGGGKGSKPQKYRRPWPDTTSRRVKPSVSQEDVIAALRYAGHLGPVPGAD